MTSSLVDRVRERLAAQTSGALHPNAVAAAIRAESGGVVADSDVLAGLRVVQTELTGAGILEPLLRGPGTTDVLVSAPDDSAVYANAIDAVRIRLDLDRYLDGVIDATLSTSWSSLRGLL